MTFSLHVEIGLSRNFFSRVYRNINGIVFLQTLLKRSEVNHEHLLYSWSAHLDSPMEQSMSKSPVGKDLTMWLLNSGEKDQQGEEQPVQDVQISAQPQIVDPRLGLQITIQGATYTLGPEEVLFLTHPSVSSLYPRFFGLALLGIGGLVLGVSNIQLFPISLAVLALVCFLGLYHWFRRCRLETYQILPQFLRVDKPHVLRAARDVNQFRLMDDANAVPRRWYHQFIRNIADIDVAFLEKGNRWTVTLRDVYNYQKVLDFLWERKRRNQLPQFSTT